MKRARTILWRRYIAPVNGLLLIMLTVLGPGWALFHSQALPDHAQKQTATAHSDEQGTPILHSTPQEQPHDPQRYVLAATRDTGTYDLHALDENDVATHIKSYRTRSPIEIPTGLYKNTDNAVLRSAVRDPGYQPSFSNPRALGLPDEIVAKLERLPSGAFTLLVVDHDDRWGKRQSSPNSARLERELQSSLARLPIPTYRWKNIVLQVSSN